MFTFSFESLVVNGLTCKVTDLPVNLHARMMETHERDF